MFTANEGRACDFPHRPTIALTILLLLFGVSFAMEGLPYDLTRAEECYSQGRFDEAILLLKDFLEKPEIAISEEEAALRLLGLTYLAKEYRDDALEAAKRLIRLVPEYKPDPEDIPPYKEIVEQARLEIEAEEAARAAEGGEWKKWAYVGGGAVIAAVAIGLATGGSDDGGGDNGTPLPPISSPPDLPELPR